MQTFKKLFLCILVFIFCVAVVSVPSISAYYNYINNTSSIPEDFKKYDGQIDTLFLGSSYTRVSVDNEKYDKAFGTTSYSFSSNRMYMPSNYHSLCKILKTNTIKKLYMELSYDNLFDDPHGSIESTVNYYKLISENKEKTEYTLKYAGPDNYLKIYGYLLYNGYPIFVKNQIHKTYILYKSVTTKNQYVDDSSFSNASVEIMKGFIPEKEGCFSDFSYSDYAKFYHSVSKKVKEVNKTQKEYLNKIIELCQENNIEVTFIVYPVTDYFIIANDNNEMFEKVCADIGKETGCPIWNFNLISKKSDIFDDSNDFYNKDHLNYSGAEKLTKILIEAHQKNDLYIFSNSYSTLEKNIINKSNNS